MRGRGGFSIGLYLNSVFVHFRVDGVRIALETVMLWGLLSVAMQSHAQFLEAGTDLPVVAQVVWGSNEEQS